MNFFEFLNENPKGEVLSYKTILEEYALHSNQLKQSIKNYNTDIKKFVAFVS